MASQILPRRERQWTMFLYAWCRRADDAVDEGTGDKRAALARLRSELDDIEDGRRTGDTIVDGFAEVMRHCQIPLLYARELLCGMEDDIEPVVYQTMDDLYQYSYRVAGTVGLMMTHIVGIRDHAAVANAAHLGVAMQLTNICRDVVEDWERGRLYLPRELLTRHGVTELGQPMGQPIPKSALGGIGLAVEELLTIADRYYQSGDAGLDQLPWRCSVAIAAARKIYAEIGEVLKSRHCDVSARRAFVPFHKKLSLVGQSIAARVVSLPMHAFTSERHSHFAAPNRSLAFADMPRL